MLENKIEIIVNGNKVIAKKDGKVGVAKCSPEDEFDIFTGVRLAIDRLEEKCWLKEDMTTSLSAVKNAIKKVCMEDDNIQDMVSKEFESKFEIKFDRFL